MKISGESFKLLQISEWGAWSTNLVAMDKAWMDFPWAANEWALLSAAVDHLYVLGELHAPRGFALYRHLVGDDTAHLLKICVDPVLRGSGASRDFVMRQCADLVTRLGARQVYLEVAEQNHRARSFYQRFGWFELRRQEHYYSDGQAAVIMLLDLTSI